MWSTFLNTLRVSLREKSALFWLFCFPILLSTMFFGMFGNLDETYTIKTLQFAVVADETYCQAPEAQQLLTAMQQTPLSIPACSTEQSAVSSDSVIQQESGLQNLLALQAVATQEQAISLITSDTDVQGFLMVDTDGLLHMTISNTTVSDATNAMGSSGLTISLSILNGAIGMFNRQNVTLEQILTQDPAILQRAGFLENIQQTPTFTQTITLTNFEPSESARYYYALLALTALMSMAFAVSAVCNAQANLSALGIRRSLAPLTKFKQLLAGFLASWLCTLLSLIVAFLYIHFVCKVSFGDRWGASFLALVVASFAANALGTLLGAIPKLPASAKIGLTTACACALSLLSGLYGSGAMALSDWIQRHAPVLATINPTQQITNLFYDILYYDSYAPFAHTIGILLIMSVLALALATVFLRRQRYEHL